MISPCCLGTSSEFCSNYIEKTEKVGRYHKEELGILSKGKGNRYCTGKPKSYPFYLVLVLPLLTLGLRVSHMTSLKYGFHIYTMRDLS